jgi:hypothetical protein
VAGDWIKMGKDLLTHPKVVRMASALHADKLRTVGGLFAVWCLFDTHSVDGQLSGYTPETIDDEIRFPGFSAAMEAVVWLKCDDEGSSLPDFEDHNGQSAKRRAQETDRKRIERKTSASDADKKRTREEKRREETLPNGSDGAQAAPTTPKRGTRLAQDWFLPQAWGQWALDKFPHFTPEIVRDEALKFANHWRATTGKSAAKLDWYGTWQNWCMSDICQRSHAPPGKSTETNYARQMRERVEEATGQFAQAVAAKAPGTVKAPAPWEIAIENRNRTAALGMGGCDLHEDDDAPRARLPEPL